VPPARGTGPCPCRSRAPPRAGRTDDAGADCEAMAVVARDRSKRAPGPDRDTAAPPRARRVLGIRAAVCRGAGLVRRHLAGSIRPGTRTGAGGAACRPRLLRCGCTRLPSTPRAFVPTLGPPDAGLRAVRRPLHRGSVGSPARGRGRPPRARLVGQAVARGGGCSGHSHLALGGGRVERGRWRPRGAVRGGAAARRDRRLPPGRRHEGGGRDLTICRSSWRRPPGGRGSIAASRPPRWRSGAPPAMRPDGIAVN
jgi:hypothetical protein